MLHLFMVTPEKMIYNGDIVSLLVPGADGYFEVLKDHTPIIASLMAGQLSVINANKHKIVWAISGGIVEVAHNEATVLADSLELATEIDISRAKYSLKMAQAMIANAKTEEEKINARNKLKRAKNRLKIAKAT